MSEAYQVEYITRRLVNTKFLKNGVPVSTRKLFQVLFIESFPLEVPQITPVIVNPALFLMEGSGAALVKYNVTVVKMWLMKVMNCK